MHAPRLRVQNDTKFRKIFIFIRSFSDGSTCSFFGQAREVTQVDLIMQYCHLLIENEETKVSTI